MKSKYRAWIKRYCRDNPVKGACMHAARRMADEFPELEVVRGNAIVGNNRIRHTWCVSETGTVVDPTASQFEVAVSQYEEAL